VPYDEWQIVYRKIAQLARAVDDEPQLLEWAAGEKTMRSDDRWASERTLGNEPTSSLIRQLLNDTGELFKKEVALAKAEVAKEVQTTITKVVGMAVAGLCAFLGMGLLCAAAVMALAHRMDDWKASLLVGVLLFAIAGVVLAVVRSRKSEKPLQRTQRTLKEDVQWAKEQTA